MSVLFITFLFFLIIGALAFVGGMLIMDNKRPAKIVGGGLIFIALVFGLFSSLTTVPARSVGVVTSFGRPLANLKPGIHWKRPWYRVSDMNGQIVNDQNLGDQRTEIRMGNQANAYVQNIVRWKINTEAAEELYADYRDDDKIGPALVEPELSAALNYAFSDYDPLGAKLGQSYDNVANEVKNRLNERIGSTCKGPDIPTLPTDPCNKIIIESVIIPKVDFDNDTQARINSVQAENAKTRVATQSVQTAKQEKLANDEIAKGLRDPNVLVSKCLDRLRDLPAGGQCWPNTGGSTIVQSQR